MPLAPVNSTPGVILSCGAWLWSREAGGYVQELEPRSFGLHVIYETDPSFHVLARGERVAVGAPAFLLWMPIYVPAVRLHHRGTVAAAVDAATHDVAPDLLLDGRPYVFLRVGAPEPSWLGAYLAGRDVWFSYDGSSLHALRGFKVEDGLIVIDFERVVA